MHEKRDNIGVLRLLFASMVIVGHAPELIDGDRSREPLTQIFHTLSLGEVAVAGFFLLSGYLITQSVSNGRSYLYYFVRRALRIYPAYIVAFLLCALFMPPIVGGRPDGPLMMAVKIAALAEPHAAGALVGFPYPALNGAMWTIAYEFHCYVLIACFAAAGLLKRRYWVLSLTFLGLLTIVAMRLPLGEALTDGIDTKLKMSALGFAVSPTVEFTTTFLVGACVYLFRDEVLPRLNGRTAILCALTLTPFLLIQQAAGVALVTLGAGSLFWVAFKAELGPLQRVNDRWDVSYGTYLYGWPISTMFIWFHRDIGPWLLGGLTLPVAVACGAASWWGLERWAQKLGRSSIAQPPLRRV